MKTARWFAALLCLAGVACAAPRVDHHQHLLAPSMTAPGQAPIDGDSMIHMLDDAGIHRAVLLSNAFREDDYARVMAENDWTGREAAKYPRRLVALCSFNPLEDYAVGEIGRCAHLWRLGRGIKLQFGASDVNLDDPIQVALLRRVFRTANENHMAIVVHMRTRRAHPYGAAQAQTFIDELMHAAPDVPVQIAHFCGGGSVDDPAADEALAVFTAAIARNDPRVKNLYFDLALVAPAGLSPQRAQWVAERIREIGLKRILYGSDGGDPTDPPPKVQVQAFRKLPLTEAEFRVIESNVAPYLR